MNKSNFAGLDLQGYKTFARDTNLVFPSRITAIVGPNGSGKSNVADSIRWVLGEQSYSLLRAKKTEDMIYSGSDSRARAGMAAVSIKFNNEDKWLPIDYSEVVLTRRAYRDGKNDYLINNQKVRLKDFTELLGKTGLSDRTYTIIGQGLVDTVLSFRPDERSKLFEEASGIGLYQNRKTEAVRRLELTERNLERALDIIAEIKPRVRSLEKQAARVIEYKTVQDLLKQSLRDWYGYHWYKALRDVNQTQQKLQNAELERQSVRKSFEQEQSELNTLRSEIEQQRIKVNGIMNNLREMRNQLQQNNQKLAILDERKSAAEKAKQQLVNDLANLEEVIKSSKASHDNHEADEVKTREDLRIVQEQFEILSISRSKILEQEASLKKEENALRDAQIELEKEAVVLRSRKQEMTERLQSLKSSQATIQNNMTSLEEEKNKLDQAIIATNEKVQLAEAELLDLKNKANSFSDERAKLTKDLEGFRQSSHKLDLEKNRVRNRLELLKQSRESLSGFSDGAKTLLKSSREKKLHNELTDLATHIEVPEEFELAISAALGEAVDLLIIRDAQIGTKVLNELSEKLNDRVAILSQVVQEPKSRAKKTNEGGLIASEVVKTDPSLRSVVDLLLDDFVIVEDINAAFSAREKQADFNYVCRTGEVLMKNGMAVIGKANQSSKVSYTRLVNELSEELKGIESSAQKIDQASNQLSEKIRKLDEQIAANQELSKKQQSNRDILIRESQSNSLNLEKIRSRIEWIERQKTDNKSSLENISETIKKLSAQEEVNKDKSDKLAEQQKEQRRKRAEFQPEDIENQYRYQESEIKVLTQSLNHLIETRQNESRRLEADLASKAKFLTRMGEHETVLSDLESQISELVKQISDEEKEINSQQTEMLDPQLVSLRDMEVSSRQHSEAGSGSQKSLTEKDRQVVHFQLELAHQQERLENLKSRIDDDFSLIEMEYRKEYTQSEPLPFPDMVIETLPEMEGLPEGLADAIKEQKAQLRRIGTVNLEADQEYREVKERYESLTSQVQDLNAALEDIQKMIKELDTVMKVEFLKTFKAVSVEFSTMFSRLFNGGSARLILNDEESPIEAGIDIEARLPGKREQGLVLLSGGERSLTAVALVFALLKVSPTPFCVLDEVDAMLDESNVGRFIELLKDLSSETQFVLITHNRNTVSAADVIYGVTMGKDSASQVISLRLDEVDESFVR
ncbi:MAG: chromosome segregation protein SMC [Anaerolineaceae bacterium]|nr:chromosome segregation protein SMC [Anaerolineaceae bacterium]